MRAGSRAGRHDLNREAGTGSKGQAMSGDPLMSSSTSASERSLKDENDDEASGSGKELRLESEAGSDDLILATLSSKNESLEPESQGHHGLGGLVQMSCVQDCQ